MRQKLMPDSTRRLGPDEVRPKDLPAKPSRYVCWDTYITGLGLCVFPTSKKSWVFKGRSGGIQKMKTLGSYPAYTLEQAQAWGLGLQIAKASGVDIALPAPKSITVSDLCDLAERDWWPELAETTQSAWSNVMKNHIRPQLGRLLVRKVEFSDVGKFRQYFVDLGVGSTGNQGLAILKGMFDKAEEWGHRDHRTNPVVGISYFPKHMRERHLNPDEVATIFQALESSTAAKEAKDALKLLFWTGIRKCEVLNLKWSQVHLDTQQIIIPAKLHKTGEKTGDRVIQLPPEAVELLQGVRKWERIPSVFPGAKGGKCWAIDRLWRDIRAGIRPGETLLDTAVIHTIRHTVASFALSTGMSLKEVGSILGHKDTKTTERYAKLMIGRSTEVAALAAAAIHVAAAKKISSEAPA